LVAMKLGGADLLARLQKKGSDDDARAAQVSRAAFPARADGYRPGWMQVPSLSMTPFKKKNAAAGRSSSVPGTSRSTAASECNKNSLAHPANQTNLGPTSSSSAAVRTSSVPLGDRAPCKQSAASHDRQNIGTPNLEPRSSMVSNTSDAASDFENATPRSCGSSGLLHALPAVTEPTSAQGVQHCGWLAKRTSGKVSARWQQRYFTLDGHLLRYHSQPGAPSRKSFDLRKARRISTAEAQPRELEVDFGFRVWRLRAESPESARRWLVLLEAATLVAGNWGADDEECEDPWSDGENSSAASTSSTADSVTSAESLPCKTVASMRSAPSCPRPSVVVDTLELDPANLDKQFDQWFQFLADANGEEDQRVSDLMQSALSEAVCGLWCAFGAAKDAASGLSNSGAEAAAEALRGSRLEPQALCSLIEEVLGEYLERMRRQVERWLQQQPSASDIASIVGWLLLQAHPALERFATAASELLGVSVNGSSSHAEQLEHILLGEWEPKAIDDACQRCEEAYEDAPPRTGDHLGSVAQSADSDEVKSEFSFGPDEKKNTCVSKPALVVLEEILVCSTAWRSHPSARERAACVMVAALSATLRAHHSHARRLFAPAALGVPSDLGAVSLVSGRKHKQLRRAGSRLLEFALRALKEIHCSAEESLVLPSAVGLVTSTAEAIKLAAFCHEAAATPGMRLGAALGTNALPAFAAAFEREGLETSEVLAEMNFASTCRFVLGQICFHPRALHEPSSPPPSVLESACISAHAFLDEIFADGLTPSAWQACAAISRLLIRRWARAFCKAAPRMRTCRGLLAAVEADERALHRLTQRWGAAEHACNEASNPAVPMQEVVKMLRTPTSKVLSTGAARLESVMGEVQSKDLVSAVRVLVA